MLTLVMKFANIQPLLIIPTASIHRRWIRTTNVFPWCYHPAWCELEGVTAEIPLLEEFALSGMSVCGKWNHNTARSYIILHKYISPRNFAVIFISNFHLSFHKITRYGLSSGSRSNSSLASLHKTNAETDSEEHHHRFCFYCRLDHRK